MKEIFRKISARISNAVGSAIAFLLALTVVIVWALTGPIFGFSDTWQLVINTGTTIVTFLMVFLIQNTQNRDSKALHLKLDELIRSTKSARDSFVKLDDLTDEELNTLDEEFKTLHEKIHSEGVHKLHKRIAAEKERRVTIKSAGKAAGQAITSILKAPISVVSNSNNDDSKKSKK